MTSANAGQRSGQGASSVLAEISEQEGRRPEPGTRSRASRTVLVVDDHDALRYATRKVLERAGFKTVEAATGADGIFAAAGVDAVVLDVNLPDINGVEVLRALRRENPSVPVVLTSAVFVDDLHRGAGLDAGADAYLVAPIDHDELTSTLDRILGTSLP